MAKTKAAKKPTKRRWSQHVAETSDALDIRKGTFANDDPKTIAGELKHAAETSTGRKSNPFRSAMSMLVFFINRAGRNESAERQVTLEAAKGELRQAFGRDEPVKKTPTKRTSTKRAKAR